jgi:hypothetical protein
MTVGCVDVLTGLCSRDGMVQENENVASHELNQLSLVFRHRHSPYQKFQAG